MATKVKHGHSSAAGRSPTYKSWHGMKQRATNPNVAAAKHYTGRGIDMDPRWSEFTNFLADMGERPKGTTLDRIDNNRGYWKDNCRWATHDEQHSNKRTNVFIEWQGRRQTIQQWSKETGICFATLRYRMDAGWPVERVLSKKRYAKNQFTPPT